MTMTETKADDRIEVEADGVRRLIDMQAGRRAFLRTIGLGATAAAVFGGGAVSLSAEAWAATLNDADILNFALNLEYLEAEFYLIGALGRRLETSETTGVGHRGNVTGGRQVMFSSSSLIGRYVTEIAGDEEAHVKFLRAALGNAAVARPQLNIGTAFTAAAQAAGLGSGFDAYENDDSFAIAAFIFEDVGVTAYKGAARFIKNKDYLEAAAGILAVEAYHAATIRSYLYGRQLTVAARKISDLRDSVDGPTDLDQGLYMDGVNIVPTDKNGIAFSRSPQQVLKIVYLGGDTSGGFFPQGLNGNLK